MSTITIHMKDGTTKKFKHEGRGGGSYSKHLTFEGDFVIITDEYYTRTCIPSRDIKEIIEEPQRY